MKNKFLTKKDIDLFYKLHPSLMMYAGEKLGMKNIPKNWKTFRKLSLDIVNEFRTRLYENTDIFDQFIKENPHNFSDKELEIVREWKHFLKGKFFLMEYTDTQGMFLDSNNPPRAHAVSSLKSSFEDMFCLMPLPIYMEAVFLPFKGQIIYDGILQVNNIIFGRHMTRNFKEDYKKAKKKGIITVLS
ncbi:MAG: hypothetical protein NTV02_00390 [Candidatus Zambryskibacteria bacterium]|nr:hypothetical protein [Candidatus Zambryskibacteria bacterium]